MVRKRSPKYPYIPLEKALERTEQLYRAEGRNYTPMTTATKTWGYQPKSSGGIQTVAALVGYGLLEDTGTKETRKVRVSELGRRILLDKRPDSEERVALTQEAALTPEIFNSLWLAWKETGLPSEANMRHTLIFEYAFNENTVDRFIRVFTETMKFAGLEPGEEEDEDEGTGPIAEARPVTARKGSDDGLYPGSVPRVRPDVNMQQATFPLAEGVAVIQWPRQLSQESYDDFKDWVELTLRRAKRSIVTKEDTESGEDDDIFE